MKVVALISGGKDSCYNMIQCVAEGHELVALANLYPKQTDELDSYMYQTVGHHVIELYAEAIGLPLYRQAIEGGSLQQGKDYRPTEGDEVEDLYQLLLTVKREMGIEAVSVGAILSNYQRVRVENVCSRLGLTSLAFLWRRNQEELLQEMIDAQVDAIIIKVAALGLTSKHLGMTLAEIQPHMLIMKDKYQLNVCGEGGEFETVTLDCPLFNKKIVIDSKESVTHSDDAFAPVHYLHFKSMHLEDKVMDTSLPFSDRISKLPIKRGSCLLQELGCDNTTQVDDEDAAITVESTHTVLTDSSVMYIISADIFHMTPTHRVLDATKVAMETLTKELQQHDHTLSDVAMVHLYVGDMCNFASINSVYCQYFTLNPPARVCVQVNLPKNVAVQIDCLSHHQDQSSQDVVPRHTMHVQGISHWAPANIGPYSQAVQLGNTFFCAGIIGLCPSSMQMIEGGITTQCKLSLRSVSRVLEAMHNGLSLSSIIINVCYVSDPRYMSIARHHWEAALSQCLDDDLSSYGESPKVPCLLCTVVVPMLPKGALVEWHVVANKDKQQWKYKEKSRVSKHNYTVSLQVLHSESEDRCCAIMTSVDWSDDGDWSDHMDTISSHVMDCIRDELKDTRLTFHDVLSLRLFYQQNTTGQVDMTKSFQHSFVANDVPCPAITTVPVGRIAGNYVLSVIFWFQQ
ncbi:uncharacterized protein [Amphiura filiformis]|uniref:uncharacterized protein n=1 Tax=Amphiura filiformis TaxID=82378 RepID=UPI003B21BDE4